MDFKYWCAIGLGCSLSYAVVTLVFLCLYAQKEINEDKTRGDYMIISGVSNVISSLVLIRYFLQYFINDTDLVRIRFWFFMSVLVCVFSVLFAIIFGFFIYADQYYEISTPLYILFLIPLHILIVSIALFVTVLVLRILHLIFGVLIGLCKMCGCQFKTQAQTPTQSQALEDPVYQAVSPFTQSALTTAEQQV